MWTPSAGQGRFWLGTVMPVAGLCPACSPGNAAGLDGLSASRSSHLDFALDAHPVATENRIWDAAMGYPRSEMLGLLKLLSGLLVGLFRSHAARGAETANSRACISASRSMAILSTTGCAVC